MKQINSYIFRMVDCMRTRLAVGAWNDTSIYENGECVGGTLQPAQCATFATVV